MSAISGRFLLFGATTLGLSLMASCNSADFGAGTSGGSAAAKNCNPEQEDCSAPGDGDTDGPDPSDAPSAKDCVDGDKLKLEWSGDVKECLIDQGKTYNFELKQCAEMKQATFDCTWDNVTAELEKRDLLTNTLRTDSSNGAKLVTCGQSADGRRIVVQWVKLPDSGTIDCASAAQGASVTTGCYTLYQNGEERPADPTSDEEKARQVYDCMNKL